jgi:glutamine cyclotransferase
MAKPTEESQGNKRSHERYTTKRENPMKSFNQHILITEVDSKYIVERNPHDKLWYAMGHVGRNKWMPVSSGFKSKSQAQRWAKSQVKVDIAARGEVGGV